jgi:hypothetical protein
MTKHICPVLLEPRGNKEEEKNKVKEAPTLAAKQVSNT